jgi:hypothetical protein
MIAISFRFALLFMRAYAPNPPYKMVVLRNSCECSQNGDIILFIMLSYQLFFMDCVSVGSILKIFKPEQN